MVETKPRQIVGPPVSPYLPKRIRNLLAQTSKHTHNVLIASNKNKQERNKKQSSESLVVEFHHFNSLSLRNLYIQDIHMDTAVCLFVVVCWCLFVCLYYANTKNILAYSRDFQRQFLRLIYLKTNHGSPFSTSSALIFVPLLVAIMFHK